MKASAVKAKSSVVMVIVAGLFVTALIFGASCGDGEPAATPTPGLTPSPTPTAAWSPDGVISPGEYGKMETHGNYEIHWRSDGQHIFVGMKAETSGFVAVGIQPGNRMKDADIVFGFVKDGETTIHDMFSTGDFGPHPPDTELGGTYDIIDFGGKEEGEFTTIEFSRSLVTGDEFDSPLSAGTNKIIWSYGSSDEVSLQHSTRGYGELDL